jgi:HK97 family phage major capsid protein
MIRLLELREKRAKAWDAAKAFLDGLSASGAVLSAEDNAVYERMEAEVVELGKEIERLDRRAAIDAELAAPTSAPVLEEPGALPSPGAPDGAAGAPARKSERAGRAYNNAFWEFIRSPKGGWGPDVRGALQIGSDPEGGYLVPDEFERQLIDALQEENIMRRLARVIQTQYGDRKIPLVSGHGVASWVDEEAVIPLSDESFGQITMSAFKAATMIKISNELLNDSVFNMPAYIAQEFGRRIGALEEEAFFKGNGTGKPKGVTLDAQTGVTAAAQAAVTFDEIMDLYYSLRIPYRRRAVFMMHDAAVKAIRKLKGADGQYLWQPSVQDGQPDRILSRPLYTSQYMPTLAASAKTVLFGDFSYYWIADRAGRTFRRLDELYAATDQVGFKVTQRVDGKLILPEAVKALAQAPPPA